MILITVNNKASTTLFETKDKAISAIDSFYTGVHWHEDYAVDQDGREIRMVEVTVVNSAMDFHRPK